MILSGGLGGDAFMMINDFVNDESKEFFRKIRIETGVSSEGLQPLNLSRFARWIGRLQTDLGFIFANGLGDFKSLRKEMDDRCVEVIDRLSHGFQRRIVIPGH